MHESPGHKSLLKPLKATASKLDHCISPKKYCNDSLKVSIGSNLYLGIIYNFETRNVLYNGD